MLKNYLNRWAWLVFALFLALTTQPCPHEPGEACLNINKGLQVRAFGLYAIEVQHQDLDTCKARFCSDNHQSLPYDTLSARNQLTFPHGLP